MGGILGMKWAVKRAIGNSKVFAHHQKRAPYWNLITHWITLSSPLDSASLALLASRWRDQRSRIGRDWFPIKNRGTKELLELQFTLGLRSCHSVFPRSGLHFQAGSLIGL
jgi:hypothetical protein